MWRPGGSDVAHAVVLVVVSVLLWCAHFDRWTPASWQVPLTYLGDSEKNDVFHVLSYIKAAHDGHISMFFPNMIPELNAPGTGNWNDFPLTEKPMILVTGFFSGVIGLMAAANLSVMMSQVLAALTLYVAARLLGAAPVWSAAGGILFGFERYAYSQSLHHLMVEHFWIVPMGVVLCDWLLRGRLTLTEGRFKAALVVAVMIGVQNVYNSYLFAQFFAIAAVYRAWREGWRAALPAVALIATMLAAFSISNLNTILYQLENGAGGAVERHYQWLEFYGLKVIDLIIPPPDHPVPFLAAWGAAYGGESLLANGERPPSAYLGLMGLGAVLCVSLVSLKRVASGRAPPLEALMILYILFYGAVGGFNGFLGTLGFQLIRTTTRYSMVLLCIALIFTARFLTRARWGQRPALAYPLAIVLALFAYWDSAPPAFTDKDVADVAAQIDSDRQFVAALEARLPAGSMIFQLPVMDFPESPGVKIGGSDELRLYLYSHHLRYSFGTNKGRGENDWQHALENLAPAAFASEVAVKGFDAICIDRDGYLNDGGQGLLQALQQGGYTDMLQSQRGDLVCIFLPRK
jgi:hypothetical protein